MRSRMRASRASRADAPRIFQRRGGRAALRRPRLCRSPLFQRRAGSRRWSTSPTRCRRPFRPSSACRASRCRRQFDFKKDGFNLYWWRIIEHAGTHLDAPIHFCEGGMTADRIAAEQLVVPLVMVDVSAKAAQRPRLPAVARGPRRLGKAARAVAGQLLRRDEFRLGGARHRRREIHRQGRGGRFPFSRSSRRRRRNG